MADPVTISAAIAAFMPEAIAAGELAAGATAAGMGAEAMAAMSPMALEAGSGMVGALSPVALEQGGAAMLQGSVAPGMMDKFGAMLAKQGPKLAGQMGQQMLAGDDQRMPAPGSPRMNGQQAQSTPVQVDYGGAMPRKEAGASQMLGIDEQELKRLLMSLRGY